MQKKIKIVYLLLLALVSFVTCSIKTPEITLTGEKTALENQILGSYDQLTENNIITTSKRMTATAENSQQSRAVREALQKQQLNRPEIDEFKRQHLIGENNRGYLQVLEHEKLKDSKLFAQLEKLVNEENHNRSIIYQRVLALNHKDSSAEKQIAEIFAKMQQENTAPGTMIQQLNGQWIEKIEEKE